MNKNKLPPRCCRPPPLSMFLLSCSLRFWVLQNLITLLTKRPNVSRCPAAVASSSSASSVVPFDPCRAPPPLSRSLSWLEAPPLWRGRQPFNDTDKLKTCQLLLSFFSFLLSRWIRARVHTCVYVFDQNVGGNRADGFLPAAVLLIKLQQCTCDHLIFLRFYVLLEFLLEPPPFCFFFFLNVWNQLLSQSTSPPN